MFNLFKAKPNVLVVDDDVSVAAAFKRQAYGLFTVTSFTHPHEALTAICAGQNFSAVLSDWKMPLMDGLSFLKRVSSIQPSLPLFLFTGVLDHPEFRLHTNEIRIRGIFFKPLNSMEVVNAIRSHL